MPIFFLGAQRISFTCRAAALNFSRAPAGLRRRLEPRRLFRCWNKRRQPDSPRVPELSPFPLPSIRRFFLSLPTLLRSCFLSRGFKYKSALHAAVAAAAAACSDPASLCMHGKANKQKKLATLLLLITHPPLAGALRLIRSFSSSPLPLRSLRPFPSLRDPPLVGPLLTRPFPLFFTISRKEGEGEGSGGLVGCSHSKLERKGLKRLTVAPRGTHPPSSY